MIVFSNTITPRLRYITDFIGKEIGGTAFVLTDNMDDFKNSGDLKINYSNERIAADEFWLQPHTLLFEKNSKQQNTECFEVNNNKAFFKTEGDLPFDIFAASFYLLGRYEEYLPHKKDMYGRYAHENSLAFQENFLNLPLINIWLQYFKEKLKQKFPSFTIHHSLFTFLPTYDIDEAFCYKYKSKWRTWGGYLRSIVKGQWWEVKERKDVLRGLLDDPYDSFDWIRNLHDDRHYLDAYFFILVAEKTSRYDKNNSPYNKNIQELFQDFFSRNQEPIRYGAEKPYLLPGLHPSWKSGDKPELLKKERDILFDHISSESRYDSRQHFIRFTLPATFRQLIEAGTDNDFSMGYGSINGFRASTSSSFYWYDLAAEKSTSLMLHPFCYMDANSFYEQKQTPEQALEEMLYYFDIVKTYGGTMISIWHNTFLGTHRRFAGWRETYRQFINHIYYKIPFVNEQVDKEGMDKKHFPG